jgi:hypothetical protein
MTQELPAVAQPAISLAQFAISIPASPRTLSQVSGPFAKLRKKKNAVSFVTSDCMAAGENPALF